MKNKLKQMKSDYKRIFYRTEDLNYFANEIKNFQKKLRKGQTDAKDLTQIIRDIKRNAADIYDCSLDLMKDHLGNNEVENVLEEMKEQKDIDTNLDIRKILDLDLEPIKKIN